MKKGNVKYEEWLTTIVNTRLIYNTMEELETMLDNHSIHNNGIRRCYFTQQKLRSAFRDLKVEVEQGTGGVIDLQRLMIDYQKTWSFFRENLYRRANPEKVALDLLAYCYSPYIEDIEEKKKTVFRQAIEQEVSIPLLILMLMKAIPGYDSKDGDVFDISTQYERVMKLLEKFTSTGTMFSRLPAIVRAREEQNKSRLMLLFHLEQILDTYKSYTDSTSLYDTANNIKASRYNLDIAGYWNECKGELLYTDFWQIEEALESGTYFMTHWHKDATGRLSGIRYTLFVMEDANGTLTFYILHPESILHRMKGLKYGDTDHVWYQTEMLPEKPSSLPLRRLMFSKIWPSMINLTRCVDETVITMYDHWLNQASVIDKPYHDLEYYFEPNLYAVTSSHLYIPTGKKNEYYKIPRSTHEGFDQVQLGDNVGIMKMNNINYLVFDELLLYIPVCPEELHQYNIEIVSTSF